MSAELADPRLAIALDRDPAVAAGGVVIDLDGKRRHVATSVAYEVAGALALTPVLAPSRELAPDAARTAVIVARALLEVLSGWRPASQLSMWTSFALQQDLERRAPRRPIGARLQLRGIRVSEPAAGVAEVCALADDLVQQRVRAIALRDGSSQGEWIVTRLSAG